MLLASSRVKELTLIFNADRLLAAPLPLPPLGGRPPNPDPIGDVSPDPAATAAAAATALDGPGPAPLLLLGACAPMGLF